MLTDSFVYSPLPTYNLQLTTCNSPLTEPLRKARFTFLLGMQPKPEAKSYRQKKKRQFSMEESGAEKSKSSVLRKSFARHPTFNRAVLPVIFSYLDNLQTKNAWRSFANPEFTDLSDVLNSRPTANGCGTPPPPVRPARSTPPLTPNNQPVSRTRSGSGVARRVNIPTPSRNGTLDSAVVDDRNL
jgi:hypothetical protein